jgi:hypothetical protein
MARLFDVGYRTQHRDLHFAVLAETPQEAIEKVRGMYGRHLNAEAEWLSEERTEGVVLVRSTLR